MLFEQGLGVCQESEYAGRRGMRTGDHVEVVQSVDYAYASTHLPPESILGFFRNSAQVISVPSFCPNFLRTTPQQMSLLAVSRRAAWRAAPRSSRSVVVDAPAKEWATKREAVKHHAEGVSSPPTSPEVENSSNLSLDTTDLWRKISFYGCLPASK